MRRLVFALVLAACGPAPTQPAATPFHMTAEDYVRNYGGAAGVYRRIAEETCPELAADYVTAIDNGSLGYQVAIRDRNDAIGCAPLSR